MQNPGRFTTSVGTEATGQVTHHDIAVAIADEQRRVGVEHPLQRSRRPPFGEVCTYEVPVRHDQATRLLGQRPVQVYEALEIIPDRERRSAVLGHRESSCRGCV